ncbi:ninja-family protein mc410-like [Actinidia eriantha]|uniref:ninja-family protein mc410-like n=1 Tax=Actinidia eriantha TaxID=165200 RepID=UPI002589D790|nr:ninja-family protein mc410-like [Actinidia eriantha]XP_057468402.1 ninja-family protein mc410-like [Actinidia eriantha]
MEDENGLELSLGLSCGRSSTKPKDKSDNLSDTRTDEGDRSNKLINDFKNFLEGGTQKQESTMGPQRSDPVKADDSFGNNFSNAAVDADASINLNGKGLWVANDNRGAGVDEKGPEAGQKRKSFFDEISSQKKRERESHNFDLHDKPRPSHISINTDDGSTAENEDVADSEADGSTSRLVSHHEEGAKKYIRGGPSEISKEFHTVINSSVVDLQGQNKFTISSEKEYKVGNMPYGVVPFSAQSVNIGNMPYSLSVKESTAVGVPNTTGYSMPSLMQVMTAASSERPGTQPVMPGNLPLMFGYSPVQLPVLDKDTAQGLASHPQQLHPSYGVRVPPNSGMPVILQKAPEASQYNGTALEQTKIDRKQHANDGGSSYQIEDGVKGSNTIFGAKGESDKPREGFPSEFQAIRPGIAADLKFGGCGSYPNLPWVSTKGPGPNGRTISGVTYRLSATQIKIVCACHGSHMSPEEFVQHAGEDQTNPDSGSGLASLSGNNPAASAQS